MDLVLIKLYIIILIFNFNFMQNFNPYGSIVPLIVLELWYPL